MLNKQTAKVEKWKLVDFSLPFMSGVFNNTFHSTEFIIILLVHNTNLLAGFFLLSLSFFYTLPLFILFLLDICQCFIYEFVFMRPCMFSKIYIHSDIGQDYCENARAQDNNNERGNQNE
jgi:hypothetical protein